MIYLSKSEFSPSQIDLKNCLEIVKKHEGNWKALEDTLQEDCFDKNKTSLDNSRRSANNTKLEMMAYGIIDRDAKKERCLSYERN